MNIKAEEQEVVDMLNGISEAIDKYVPDGDQVSTLNAYLEARCVIAAGASGFKKVLESLDNSIKLYMISNSVTDRHIHDGMGMKIANGINKYIGEKELRLALSIHLNLNPDQINDFMPKVIKATPYDYIDMRKAKEE